MSSPETGEMATSSQQATSLHQDDGWSVSLAGTDDLKHRDFQELSGNYPDGQDLESESPGNTGTDDCSADNPSQTLDNQPSGSHYHDIHTTDNHIPEVQDHLKGMIVKEQKREAPRPQFFRQDKSEPQEEAALNLSQFEVRRLPNEPRRPKNAFMIFSAEERLKLKDSGKGQDNRAVSRLLGAQWRAMSAAEKRPYQEEAAELYHQVKKDNPNWRYSPAVIMAREPEVLQSSRLRPRDKVKWTLPPLLKRPYRRRTETFSNDETRMSVEASDLAHELSKQSHQKQSLLLKKRQGAAAEHGEAFRKKVAKKRRTQKVVVDIEIDRDEPNTLEQINSGTDAGLPRVDRVWTEVWRSEAVPIDQEEVQSDCEDDAYGCSVCGKWFRSSEAVEAHIFTHTSKKKSTPTRPGQKKKKKLPKQSKPITVQNSGDEENGSSSTSTGEGSPFSIGHSISSKLAAVEVAGTGKETGVAKGDKSTKIPAALEGDPSAGQGITAVKSSDGGPQWIMVPLNQLPNLVPKPTFVSAEPTMILVPVEPSAVTHVDSKMAVPLFVPQNPMSSTVAGNIAARHPAVPVFLQGLGPMKQVK